MGQAKDRAQGQGLVKKRAQRSPSRVWSRSRCSLSLPSKHKDRARWDHSESPLTTGQVISPSVWLPGAREFGWNWRQVWERMWVWDTQEPLCVRMWCIVFSELCSHACVYKEMVFSHRTESRNRWPNRPQAETRQCLSTLPSHGVNHMSPRPPAPATNPEPPGPRQRRGSIISGVWAGLVGDKHLSCELVQKVRTSSGTFFLLLPPSPVLISHHQPQNPASLKHLSALN